MVCKDVDAIIDDYGALERSPQRTKIFHVNTVNEGTLLSVQPVSEVLVVWVEDLNDRISVFFLH